MSGPKTLFDKIWESHVVAENDDGNHTPLCRQAPHSRGDELDRLRAHGRGRAPGAPPRRHPGRARPFDPDQGPRGRRRRHRRPPRAQPGGGADRELRALRGPPDPANGCAPGHRPHHRAGAGPDAAGRDARLRRQPHRNTRRLRLPRLRHRLQRGRACARDPDAEPEAPAQYAHHSRRRPARGHHRQGHDPRHHRRDRHRGRHWPRGRVRRPRDPRALPWKGG